MAVTGCMLRWDAQSSVEVPKVEKKKKEPAEGPGLGESVLAAWPPSSALLSAASRTSLGGGGSVEVGIEGVGKKVFVILYSLIIASTAHIKQHF